MPTAGKARRSELKLKPSCQLLFSSMGVTKQCNRLSREWGALAGFRRKFSRIISGMC